MKNFSVFSWNIQGRTNFTGYTFFKKIRPHLLKSPADIIALQEICGAEELLRGIEDFRQYHIFVPKLNNRTVRRPAGFNHNVLLSKCPILRTDEIVFPRWNKNLNLENCSVAEIQIDTTVLRIYNCHFAVFRVGIATRLKQLEYILSHSNSHNGPIIICGDLNATIPQTGWRRKVVSLVHQEPVREMTVNGKFIDRDEREIFNQTINRYGFKEVLDLDSPTWSPWKSQAWETFKLKLDWFMVKNLDVDDYKLGEYISDHKSIEVKCHIGN